MIFIVRRPQYFISHTKSQRLLVTRLRLSCEKVNLDNTNNHNTHNQALSSISRFYALLLDLTDFSNPPQRHKISAPSLSSPPPLNIFIPPSLYQMKDPLSTFSAYRY